jgi:hypothetical protein
MMPVILVSAGATVAWRPVATVPQDQVSFDGLLFFDLSLEVLLRWMKRRDFSGYPPIRYLLAMRPRRREGWRQPLVCGPRASLRKRDVLAPAP